MRESTSTCSTRARSSNSDILSTERIPRSTCESQDSERPTGPAKRPGSSRVDDGTLQSDGRYRHRPPCAYCPTPRASPLVVPLAARSWAGSQPDHPPVDLRIYEVAVKVLVALHQRRRSVRRQDGQLL